LWLKLIVEIGHKYLLPFTNTPREFSRKLFDTYNKISWYKKTYAECKDQNTQRVLMTKQRKTYKYFIERRLRNAKESFIMRLRLCWEIKDDVAEKLCLKSVSTQNVLCRMSFLISIYFRPVITVLIIAN